MTEQKTFGKYYPGSKPGTSLCKSCVKRGWNCIHDQVWREIVKCPDYAMEYVP